MDQANNLRNLMNNAGLTPTGTTLSNVSARVITVTSGKGGVGKSNFSANLAIQFAKMGKRVVIVDADFGLANIEVIFGILPRFNLANVLRGEKGIHEVLTEGPCGIKFISGGSGLKELANVSDRQLVYFLDQFAYLDKIADIIIIDTGAGISKTVVSFIKASDETIFVTTPEPTSITDAYALIKTVCEANDTAPNFKIVINRVDDDEEGNEVFEKLSKVAYKFLRIKIENLGAIPYDRDLVRAVKSQRPAIISYPESMFSHSIENIGYKLMNIDYSVSVRERGLKGFVRKLANIFGQS